MIYSTIANVNIVLQGKTYLVLMISILHNDLAWLHTAPVSYITALKCK